jgi:hypothetical protein
MGERSKGEEAVNQIAPQLNCSFLCLPNVANAATSFAMTILRVSISRKLLNLDKIRAGNRGNTSVESSEERRK